MSFQASRASRIFGLYGAGGFGREVMPLVARQYGHFNDSEAYEAYFVESSPEQDRVNQYPLVSEDFFFALPAAEKNFNVAVADSSAREKLALACMARGALPATIRSEQSVIYDGNEISAGAILCAFTVVTSNIRIGKFFHANIYSYVGHDCVIGDYVTFAPSVQCNGNIEIGNHVYIGTGAVIKPGRKGRPLRIGDGAIVGMGAVVTKDVEPHTVVVGNPANLLRKS